MAHSEDSTALLMKKMERETIIQWDETDSPAVLWTASPSIRKQWESYGFPVQVYGGGWRAKVPPDRVMYRTMKK